MSPNAAASANVPHCALPPTERSHSCPASLLAVREPIMIWCPILTSVVAMALPTMPVPRIAMFIVLLILILAVESGCTSVRQLPKDHLSVPDEFSSQILRRIEREPDGGLCTLRHCAFGIRATHSGLDPAGTHRVHGDAIRGQLRSEDTCHSVERGFGDAIGGVIPRHLTQ